MARRWYSPPSGGGHGQQDCIHRWRQRYWERTEVLLETLLERLQREETVLARPRQRGTGAAGGEALALSAVDALEERFHGTVVELAALYYQQDKQSEDGRCHRRLHRRAGHPVRQLSDTQPAQAGRGGSAGTRRPLSEGVMLSRRTPAALAEGVCPPPPEGGDESLRGCRGGVRYGTSGCDGGRWR